MTINEKLQRFLKEEKITHAELAALYEKSPQYISYIMRGGKVPLDLVVLLKQHYPNLDLNKLMSDRPVLNMVMDEPYGYGADASVVKDKILAELGIVLDRLIK